MFTQLVPFGANLTWPKPLAALAVMEPDWPVVLSATIACSPCWVSRRVSL